MRGAAMGNGAAAGCGRCGAMALLLLVGAAPAQVPSPSVDADAEAEVPTVVVTPDDPLEASDRKLAKLIRGLPGADDPVEAKRSFGEKVGDWYRANRDPNELPPDTQRTLQQTLQGGAFAPK